MISKHDLREIERLKEFKKDIIEIRKMSEEEFKRFLADRWKDSEKKQSLKKDLTKFFFYVNIYTEKERR